MNGAPAALSPRRLGDKKLQKSNRQKHSAAPKKMEINGKCFAGKDTI